LKEGRIAVSCNLEQERRLNKKFVEVEVRGEIDAFLRAVERLGCEWAQFGSHRWKMVLPEELEMTELYKAAVETDVQLRRLSYKKDSLQDIFLKAMEQNCGSL
jgi:ABC-2 type transport system ATP-binding protein